jgi:allantoinase
VPYHANVKMSPTSLPSDDTPSTNLIVVTSNRVVLDVTQNVTPATLEISPFSGKFIAILPNKSSVDDYPPDTQFLDYGDLVVMPGLVDSHVHIDEPYVSCLRRGNTYL